MGVNIVAAGPNVCVRRVLLLLRHLHLRESANARASRKREDVGEDVGDDVGDDVGKTANPEDTRDQEGAGEEGGGEEEGAEEEEEGG